MSVYIAPVDGKGRGLFAVHAFALGELLCQPCPVIELDPAGLRPDVFAYTFAWTGGRRAIAFGFASLCNHSPDPNAQVESNREERTLRLIATKPIRPGKEILITYSYRPPEWDR